MSTDTERERRIKDWNANEPLCIECGDLMRLIDGCEWSDNVEANVCMYCSGVVIEGLLAERDAQLREIKRILKMSKAEFEAFKYSMACDE